MSGNETFVWYSFDQFRLTEIYYNCLLIFLKSTQRTLAVRNKFVLNTYEMTFHTSDGQLY